MVSGTYIPLFPPNSAPKTQHGKDAAVSEEDCGKNYVHVYNKGLNEIKTEIFESE